MKFDFGAITLWKLVTQCCESTCTISDAVVKSDTDGKFYVIYCSLKDYIIKFNLKDIL